MERNKLRLIAFAVIAVAQLGVAGWLVSKGVVTAGRRELALDVTLADPVDPMRGRFLALAYGFERLTNDDFPESGGSTALLERGDEVYIVFEREGDRDGFAYASVLKPDADHAFIKATVEYVADDTSSFRVRPSVDRYYIREDLAIAADSLLRDADAARELRVRVSTDRSGDAFIVSFHVNGEPVEAYVERNMKR